MFLGHFALALAAKRPTPRTSLAMLSLAGEFLDVVWPVLVLLGIERLAIAPRITAFNSLDFVSYPWSHSLLMSIVWGVLLALIYRMRTHNAWGALWIGLVVVSHWVLDWISHRPDMPLWPGASPRLGLGLWYSRSGTIAVELAMLAVGIALFRSAMRARGTLGHVAFWSYIAVLVTLYFASVFGPPPPGPMPVALSGFGIWLFVLWAWWIDRTHEPRAVPAVISASAQRSS